VPLQEGESVVAELPLSAFRAVEHDLSRLIEVVTRKVGVPACFVRLVTIGTFV
jgi:hypothetical protein